jgi:hypothetical protein
MEFKKLCLGDVTFSGDSLDEIRTIIEQAREAPVQDCKKTTSTLVMTDTPYIVA